MPERSRRGHPPEPEPELVAPGSTGGDAKALRGIPAISKHGEGSAIPGTNPVAALMAKQPRD